MREFKKFNDKMEIILGQNFRDICLQYALENDFAEYEEFRRALILLEKASTALIKADFPDDISEDETKALIDGLELTFLTARTEVLGDYHTATGGEWEIKEETAQ